MSTNRINPKAGWVWDVKERGPNGRGLCRRCGEEVPKGRRTFCGDQCVEEWRIRSDPGFVRQKVLARDQGVCAVCGLDTEGLQRDVFGKWERVNRRENLEIRRQVQRGMLAQYGFDWQRHGLERASLWQADHIVPVVEGGGECGLENYRTLCCPCHKIVTAALKRRLAKKPANEKVRQGPLV